MSAVPELDRLLEEHEIFKSNIAWDRMGRRLIFITRAVISTALTVVALAIFGAFGIIVWPMAYKLLSLLFPYPAYRNPFIRYKRM